MNGLKCHFDGGFGRSDEDGWEFWRLFQFRKFGLLSNHRDDEIFNIFVRWTVLVCDIVMLMLGGGCMLLV